MIPAVSGFSFHITYLQDYDNLMLKNHSYHGKKNFIDLQKDPSIPAKCSNLYQERHIKMKSLLNGSSDLDHVTDMDPHNQNHLTHSLYVKQDRGIVKVRTKRSHNRTSRTASPENVVYAAQLSNKQ
jgi:hypothetical protein